MDITTTYAYPIPILSVAKLAVGTVYTKYRYRDADIWYFIERFEIVKLQRHHRKFQRLIAPILIKGYSRATSNFGQPFIFTFTFKMIRQGHEHQQGKLKIMYMNVLVITNFMYSAKSFANVSNTLHVFFFRASEIKTSVPVCVCVCVS